ncbi:MAG: S49 family peptidase [Gammaproteobacteria bacterium]|nr:MAG: S49 family peptidase [Gammaproteobacteria bacterium]
MTDNRDNWAGPAEPTPQPSNINTKPGWERDVLEKVALAGIQEQRRGRRWSIFFKILMFSYLFIVLWIVLGKNNGGVDSDLISTGKHAALIDINGVISADTEANADSVVTGLRKAFKSKHTVGVILRINSPGGSPVQSGYIADEINRLRGLHPDIPVYAVLSDICASGGYYIAANADEIYADKATLVGSIGVVMNGFGFVEAMQDLGIERRLLTAGENKGFLDPFSPLKEDEIDHVRTLLATMHNQFINVVKQGRGDRLKDDPKLFSGFLWTGEQGIELGLVDGLGSSSYVARELLGVDSVVDYTHKEPYFEQLFGRFGASVGNTLVSAFAPKMQ